MCFAVRVREDETADHQRQVESCFTLESNLRWTSVTMQMLSIFEYRVDAVIYYACHYIETCAFLSQGTHGWSYTSKSQSKIITRCNDSEINVIFCIKFFTSSGLLVKLINLLIYSKGLIPSGQKEHKNK